MSDSAIQIRTAKNREELIKQLKLTPIIEVVCQKVGVSRNTYYRWRKESKKFASLSDQAIAEGCAFINDLAESQLIKAMKENNLTAVMYWLNHRHSAYKNKLEVSGGLEIAQDKLTREQEANILRALELASLVCKEGGEDAKANTKIHQKTDK